MGEAAEGDGGAFTVEVKNVNLLILLGIEDGEDLSIKSNPTPYVSIAQGVQVMPPILA